ncbi:MAG: zinc ribbon domain-containing protein [Bifidobacteriaceae bacterium]|jgi:hypothetical protein|nr:zinc ribbon domain-containing protein [Bifidobacteriaceae bacterium]
MLQSFTRNYQDNSTEAGFQFTFYCDVCRDGYKSSFTESSTYKKSGFMRGFGEGAAVLGSLVGGQGRTLGYGADRVSNHLSHRFEGRSPQWQKEHQHSFERSQEEAKPHFNRCPNCNGWVCDPCLNEDAGLCTKCAPRQEVYVAKAHARALTTAIDKAAAGGVEWSGAIAARTTMCGQCGKPAGTGKFCNSCGADMSLLKCPACGFSNAQKVHFCNNCGHNLQQAGGAQAAQAAAVCAACRTTNPPGTKFCGNCGGRLS